MNLDAFIDRCKQQSKCNWNLQYTAASVNKYIRKGFTVPANKPVATFTTVINNLQVSFTNTSSKATNYKWDFGDGSTSLQTSPTHAYLSNGIYNVKLVAFNLNGEDSITKFISFTVGVEDEFEEIVVVYPNPARDIIYIRGLTSVNNIITCLLYTSDAADE